MSIQTGALLGLGFGAGLWLFVAGLMRRPRPPARARRLLVRLQERGMLLRLAVAAVAGVVVGWWTGWPVATFLTAAGVVGLPGLVAATRADQRTQRRLEAIAAWAESLRGTLQAAAGLEQAILATAATAPEPIRPEVTQLADALQSGARLPEALRDFADRLNHPDGDRVVAALLLAATGAARNLAEQLGELAGAARAQAAARQRVHTEWATTRTSVRMIIGITMVMALGQLTLNRSFLEPYSTPAGQLVLIVVGALFGAGFVWLARLSRIPEPPRILAPADTRQEAPA